MTNLIPESFSIPKYRPDIDIHEYYKHITGIEKEYRLSKVSKVSAFMYGHDETNIIYADALQPHAALQPNSYDVLVANPPYAVTGFLETLSDNDRAAFSLFNNNINTAKNNAIETFFMERSKNTTNRRRIGPKRMTSVTERIGNSAIITRSFASAGA